MSLVNVSVILSGLPEYERSKEIALREDQTVGELKIRMVKEHPEYSVTPLFQLMLVCGGHVFPDHWTIGQLRSFIKDNPVIGTWLLAGG